MSSHSQQFYLISKGDEGRYLITEFWKGHKKKCSSSEERPVSQHLFICFTLRSDNVINRPYVRGFGNNSSISGWWKSTKTCNVKPKDIMSKQSGSVGSLHLQHEWGLENKKNQSCRFTFDGITSVKSCSLRWGEPRSLGYRLSAEALFQ